MLETILNCLRESAASAWRVNWTHTRSAELFFIRRGADTRRAKDVTKAQVSVFHDFEEGGKKMRGVSRISVHPGMAGEEIRRAVERAVGDAAYVKNPWFELPDALVAEDASPDAFAGRPLMDVARDAADALFSADTLGDAFINSAEVFAERREERVIASNGLDVRFGKCALKGELVAQCVREADVEVYRGFGYDTADLEAVARVAREALAAARDRSVAREAPKAGVYDCVLSGEELATLLGAYAEKADAGMIFAKYSSCRVGASLQGGEIAGEKLDMDLLPSAPFSQEGVPMPGLPLAREGVLQNIHGGARFCRYLGIAPTGSYERVRVNNDGRPMDELLKAPCIRPVLFSDFQADALAGRFGGEIRLAYIYDADGVHIVTGGSISGSLQAVQKDYAFSSERYAGRYYEGPMAVRLRGVTVAGR